METGQPNSLCISSFRPWGKAYSEEGCRISDVGFRVILRTAASFAKLSTEPPEIRHPKSDILLSAILRQYAGCYRKKDTRGIFFPYFGSLRPQCPNRHRAAQEPGIWRTGGTDRFPTRQGPETRSKANRRGTC